MKVLDYNHATPIQKTSADIGLLLARVPLGVYFVLAGWGKIDGKVAEFVNRSLPSLPSFMPQALGKTYLYALPFVEVIVGACLVVGFFGRLSALLTTLMLISFIIAVTGITNPPLPFHPNLIFGGLALGLTLIGPGRISVDAVFTRHSPKE